MAGPHPRPGICLMNSERFHVFHGIYLNLRFWACALNAHFTSCNGVKTPVFRTWAQKILRFISRASGALLRTGGSDPAPRPGDRLPCFRLFLSPPQRRRIIGGDDNSGSHTTDSSEQVSLPAHPFVDRQHTPHET